MLMAGVLDDRILVTRHDAFDVAYLLRHGTVENAGRDDASHLHLGGRVQPLMENLFVCGAFHHDVWTDAGSEIPVICSYFCFYCSDHFDDSDAFLTISRHGHRLHVDVACSNFLHGCRLGAGTSRHGDDVGDVRPELHLHDGIGLNDDSDHHFALSLDPPRAYHL